MPKTILGAQALVESLQLRTVATGSISTVLHLLLLCCGPVGEGPHVLYLLKFGAEDYLMIGTDYTHGDQSGVLDGHNFIERLGGKKGIPMEVAKKMVGDDARAFYGL